MRTLLNKPVHCRNSAMLTGLCLCLIHMYAQVNATNSNSYIERYKAILLQHPEFTPFSWGSNTIYIDTEYTLYDVDKNGIPELIVKEDRSKYYIYSFNGTDVISSDVCYWSYDECLYEYEGNGIAIHDGGMGNMRIENVSLYSMVNNKLVWSGELMSTEECSSFDELYSFLDNGTFRNVPLLLSHACLCAGWFDAYPVRNKVTLNSPDIRLSGLSAPQSAHTPVRRV